MLQTRLMYYVINLLVRQNFALFCKFQFPFFVKLALIHYKGFVRFYSTAFVLYWKPVTKYKKSSLDKKSRNLHLNERHAHTHLKLDAKSRICVTPREVYLVNILVSKAIASVLL